jgi:hypothetical protein
MYPSFTASASRLCCKGALAGLGVGKAALAFGLDGERVTVLVNLRRRVGVFVAAAVVEQRGDCADARAHAGGDDDADGGARLDVARGEGHVVRGELLRDAGLARLHLGGLGDVLGLAREEHLVDAQVVGFHAPHIRRDDVSGAELDDVASDEVLGLHLHLLAASDDVGDGGLERRERLERVVGVVLSHRRDGGVDEHDDHDGDGVDVGQELVLVVAGGLDGRGRDHRGDEQVHDHGVELDDEEHEERDARGLLELVRAILLQALRRLRGGQALLAVRLELGDDVLDGLLVDLQRRADADVLVREVHGGAALVDRGGHDARRCRADHPKVAFGFLAAAEGGRGATRDGVAGRGACVRAKGRAFGLGIEDTKVRSRGDVSEDARLDLSFPPTLPILTSVAVTKGRDWIKPWIAGLFATGRQTRTRFLSRSPRFSRSKAHLPFLG